MTYDFSTVHRPGQQYTRIQYKSLKWLNSKINVYTLGPNAPIKWIEDCVKLLAPNEEKRDKLFTGLNLYGYDYTPSGGGAIVGHDYIKLLKLHKVKLEKDEKSAEHFFEIK